MQPAIFFETNRPQTCSPSGVGKKIFDVNRQLAEQPWQVFPQCGQDTCPCSSSCVDSRHDGQYNIVRQHAVPIFVLPILKELRVNMRSVDSNLGKIFPKKKPWETHSVETNICSIQKINIL